MKIKKVIKKIYFFGLNLFLDPFINAKGTPHINIIRQFLISLRYRLTSFGVFLSKNEKGLSKFKNKHLNERCFIIGNGPSLNEIDLTFLKNEVTFGVNAIYTNYEKMGFYPTYYTVEDVFVAEDRAAEINNYKESWKFFGNYLKYCINNDEKCNWLNVQFKYDERTKLPNFSTNALRKVWTGGTVSYLNIQLAYYMGFSEVYLVGFDHSYSIPQDAKVEGCDILSTGDDVNHFNKDYFGKGKRWHDPMVDRMEKSYMKAKVVFEKENRKIINATEGGQLEVFERVKYSNLFL